MEIGPVSGISVMAAPRPPAAAPEVTVSFRIESLANSGDDRYTSSGKKAAGAEEEDEEELEDSAGEDGEAAGDSGVSYFA